MKKKKKSAHAYVLLPFLHFVLSFSLSCFLTLLLLLFVFFHLLLRFLLQLLCYHSFFFFFFFAFNPNCLGSVVQLSSDLGERRVHRRRGPAASCLRLGVQAAAASWDWNHRPHWRATVNWLYLIFDEWVVAIFYPVILSI